MAEEKILTITGKKELEHQLEILKEEMAETIIKIKEAREFGDLSENAEYDAAKTEQAQIDAKIIEIEATLRTAKIIDDSKVKSDVVTLGSTVEFRDVETKEVLKMKIVGSVEANPDEGRLSNVSPMGIALMGKKKGEGTVVKAPRGDIKLEIIKVS